MSSQPAAYPWPVSLTFTTLSRTGHRATNKVDFGVAGRRRETEEGVHAAAQEHEPQQERRGPLPRLLPRRGGERGLPPQERCVVEVSLQMHGFLPSFPQYLLHGSGTNALLFATSQSPFYVNKLENFPCKTYNSSGQAPTFCGRGSRGTSPRWATSSSTLQALPKTSALPPSTSSTQR